jgi:hypothetical protein
MTAAGPPMMPIEAVPVPFEIRGGSPTLIEVTVDGIVYEMRVTPAILAVVHLRGVINTVDPDLPVLQFQAQMAVTTTRKP